VFNPSNKDFWGTFNSLLEFLGKLLFWDKKIWSLGIAVFILFFIHYVWSNRRNFANDFLPFYLISSIGLVLTANLIHGGVPVHYFLPIFTTVPILYAVYLSKIKWGFLILIALIIFNFRGYFTPVAPAFVSYNKQVEAANFIVFDAKGKPFSVRRVGLFDYFPENYSQNYKYLLLWKGGNLVESSQNVYTIVEKNGNVEIKK
jgi:hypothetical protein